VPLACGFELGKVHPLRGIVLGELVLEQTCTQECSEGGRQEGLKANQPGGHYQYYFLATSLSSGRDEGGDQLEPLIIGEVVL
jgi:hypothetical protein